MNPLAIDVAVIVLTSFFLPTLEETQINQPSMNRFINILILMIAAGIAIVHGVLYILW